MDPLTFSLMMGASGGSGALEYVALSSTATAPTSTTSLTINRPTGTISGDLMVAIIFGENNVTWTGDTGWNEVVDQGVGPSLRVAHKTAGGSEPSSYTFTSSGSSLLGGVILTYRNAAYDTVGTIATGVSGGNQVANAITLSQSGSTIIAAFARAQTASWSSPSSGLSLLDTQTVNRPSWAIYHDMDEPSGSTGTKQATPSSTSGSLSCVLVGIRPA